MNNNYMRCNSLNFLRVLFAASLFFMLGAQSARASLSVGIDMQGTNWDVSAPGNQPGNDASGMQLGFNVKIKFLKLYTGLDYLTGQFDFDNQNVPGIATINPDAKITRSEWNAVVGYYVYRYLSLFAKYKSLEFDNGSNYRLENPGLGAQLHYTLSSHWLLFGNVTRFMGDFTAGSGNDGDVDISEYEFGVAYRPALHSYIEFGIKNQRLDYDYDNDGTETHRLQGAYISYNYVF